MSDQTDGTMAAFLREHPRLIGVLFTLTILAAQAQPVLAGNGGTVDGP